MTIGEQIANRIKPNKDIQVIGPRGEKVPASQQKTINLLQHKGILRLLNRYFSEDVLEVSEQDVSQTNFNARIRPETEPGIIVRYDFFPHPQNPAESIYKLMLYAEKPAVGQTHNTLTTPLLVNLDLLNLAGHLKIARKLRDLSNFLATR